MFLLDFQCEAGYMKKTGKEVGTGGLLGGVYPFTWESCYELCNSREDCKTYHYSPSRQHCKILAYEEPLNNTDYQDFTWCSKGSNWFKCLIIFVINFAKIFKSERLLHLLA